MGQIFDSMQIEEDLSPVFLSPISLFVPPVLSVDRGECFETLGSLPCTHWHTIDSKEQLALEMSRNSQVRCR